MANKLLGTVLVLLYALVTPVSGQGLETLGNRAAALAAFVAVADDATAVAWNPAGLVIGPLFNISVDLGRSSLTPEDFGDRASGAGKVATTLLAIGVPPLGLSYYRLDLIAVEAPGPDADAVNGRQSRQVEVRTFVTSHLGATVLQSLGDHVTVGATLKLVRGAVGADIVSVESWEAGLERAERLDTRGSTAGDLDLGAMFAAGRMRVGAVVRNVTEPTFGDEDISGIDFTLKRHARLGVAWGDRWPGLSQTVVALDADLTRVPHAAGDRRDVAAGVERWLRGQQIGVRGGLRVSTTGDARPVISAGVSYAVRAGTYVDAYLARGDRDASGWGIAARLMY